MFLDDLIGYKDVISQVDEVMPRRASLSFEGGGVTVTDDPINDQTIVKIGGGGGPYQLASVTWLVDNDNDLCTAAGIATADVVRLSAPTPGLHLIGIDTTELRHTRKILLNIGSNPILLGRAGTSPPEGWAIVVPGGSVPLPPNAAVEVVWLPESASEAAGWRLL